MSPLEGWSQKTFLPHFSCMPLFVNNILSSGIMMRELTEGNNYAVKNEKLIGSIKIFLK